MPTLLRVKQTVCCTPLSLKIALSVLFDTPMQNEHFTVILHSDAVGLQKEGCLSNWNSGSLLWLDFYCADQTPLRQKDLKCLDELLIFHLIFEPSFEDIFIKFCCNFAPSHDVDVKLSPAKICWIRRRVECCCFSAVAQFPHCQRRSLSLPPSLSPCLSSRWGATPTEVWSWQVGE